MRTVGALVTVIGGALLTSVLRRGTSVDMLGLAAGSPAALAGIDIVYVAKRRIAPTYLVDAGGEPWRAGRTRRQPTAGA